MLLLFTPNCLLVALFVARLRATWLCSESSCTHVRDHVLDHNRKLIICVSSLQKVDSGTDAPLWLSTGQGDREVFACSCHVTDTVRLVGPVPDIR